MHYRWLWRDTCSSLPGELSLLSSPSQHSPNCLMQGMLQTFADLRSMLASVRRVRATLSELPPDESMVATLAPLPDAPWVDPTASQDGAAGASGRHASHPGLPDEGPALPAGEEALLDGEAGSGRAVEAAQSGDLRLEGVCFSYPTRPGASVLRDLSLTLPRGKVTAVVGRCVGGICEGSRDRPQWLLDAICDSTDS